MSDQDKPNDGRLVPAGCRELAPVAAANPLVARGLADLAHRHSLIVDEKSQSLMAQGLLFFIEGMIDEAIHQFNEALRLKPDHSPGHFLRAQAWLRKYKTSPDTQYCNNAIGDFSEAIRIEPDYTSAYEQRGIAWYLKEDYDNAIKDFDEAIRLLSESEADKRNDEKEEDSFEATRLSSMAEIYYARAEAWASKGDDDNAIKDYADAIRLDPTNATYFYSRGASWLGKQEYDKAIEDFSAAIWLDPKYAKAYSWRGLAWEGKSDYDKAIQD